LWKVGDPIERAVFIGTTEDAQNSYYIYDNRYADVTFFGESDFYSNSCRIRKTGTSDEGTLIYESKEFNAYPSAMGEKMYILQRTDEITIVANAIHSKEILLCAPKGDLLSKHEGRAVITIIYDPKVEDETFGGLHYLSGIFSSTGVTVHVVFSTYSANSFVIKEKDLPLVYKTLSDSLKEIHALYPEV